MNQVWEGTMVTQVLVETRVIQLVWPEMREAKVPLVV